MLQNPMHRSIQITWLALILSLLVPALAQVLGADPVLVWILGGTAALVCLIILPILYVTGRRYLREMQALTGGEYLVRWLLEPADWLRFTEDDWRRARKSALSTALWTAGIGIGFALVIGWFVGELNEDILLWAWIGVGLGLFLGATIYLIGRTTYQKRLGTQGEIYIGPMGLLNGGSYTSFGGFGTSLTGVAFEEGTPSAIRFEITSNGGSSQTTNTVRVPVPRGHEAEAVQVVAHFHGED